MQVVAEVNSLVVVLRDGRHIEVEKLTELFAVALDLDEAHMHYAGLFELNNLAP